jgi:hypothetical protein
MVMTVLMRFLEEIVIAMRLTGGAESSEEAISMKLAKKAVFCCSFLANF